MVTLVVIACWIVLALATGVGIGRVISRADHENEPVPRR